MPPPISPTKAVARLVRARELLHDLSRTARGVDFHQVRGAVQYEIEQALLSLIDGYTPEMASRVLTRQPRVRVDNQRGRILLLLHARGPTTDSEIRDALGMLPASERVRRGDLVDLGYVLAGPPAPYSDERVWYLSEAGRTVVEVLSPQVERAPPEGPEDMLPL
jgi:hypothetical protein